MIDIVVPTLGESITEATVAQWMKKPGEAVAKDEIVVELETDKVAVEIPAPSAGVLSEILVKAGGNVEVGGLLARIDGDASASAAPAAQEKPAEPAAKSAAAPEPAAPQSDTPVQAPAAAAPTTAAAKAMPLSPAVRRLVEEHNLDPAAIPASGREGRLTKEDVLKFVESGGAAKAQAPQKSAAPAAAPQSTPAAAPSPAPASEAPARARPHAAREEVVRMTRLRKRIAERLKDAQNTAAMLSTFNEVDMSAVMQARTRYRERFEKRHGSRLGFMSFFVRAAAMALKEVPAVNAEIDGDNIVYKNYYNIGVAVGTPQGLVVPVLKDADAMDFAEIEGAITNFGRRARDGKLSIEDMQGGTFTISNGGVYGSLMSMPILNPPQSGILGMHKIQERPMVVDGEIKICPMMYLTLSYDHRIVDGREAVTFLVRIKELVEEPDRLLLGV